MFEKDDMQDEAYFQGQKIDSEKSDGENIVAVTEDDSSSSTEAKPPREASQNKENVDQANAASDPSKAIDYEKSYRELEKKYTKDSQKRAHLEKQYQSNMQQYEQYKAYVDRIEQDQEAKNYLQQRWNGAKQVDPSLANDPLYGYLQPVVEKVQNFERFMQTQQQQAQVSEANNFLDKQIDVATKEFEAMLGDKPSNDDIVAIYEYMAQNNVFNGKTAVRDMYFEKALESKSQKLLGNQQAKKAMGTTKVVGMNSQAAQVKSEKSMTFRQALKAAKEEAGA